MPIPIKIEQPLVSKTLPVSKKTVHYRPFTVKEEKILLIATESDDPRALTTAFEQVVKNCITEDIDVGNMPLYDLEVLFLLLRAAAVNNIINFKVRDKEDNEVYEIEIDILKAVAESESNLSMPEKKIALTDNVGVVMKDMTLNLFAKSSGEQKDMSETQFIIHTLANMIDSIYDADNLFKTEDFTIEEVLEFIDGIPATAMENLNKYIDSLPRLVIESKYSTPAGERTFSMSGLSDFFQYV